VPLDLELEKDAAKYRWIRDAGVAVEIQGSERRLCEQALDDALDAEMAWLIPMLPNVAIKPRR
jgi:hypothetical protein